MLKNEKAKPVVRQGRKVAGLFGIGSYCFALRQPDCHFNKWCSGFFNVLFSFVQQLLELV